MRHERISLPVWLKGVMLRHKYQTLRTIFQSPEPWLEKYCYAQKLLSEGLCLENLFLLESNTLSSVRCALTEHGGQAEGEALPPDLRVPGRGSCRAAGPHPDGLPESRHHGDSRLGGPC